MGLVTGFLLDTHTLLWWNTASERLPESVRDALNRRDQRVCVSAVSGYEIALKNRIGKLPNASRFLDEFAQTLVADGFEQLSVTCRHALVAGRLDPVHKDPFDRILIAQALVEDLTILSNEKPFDRYGVRRLW